MNITQFLPAAVVLSTTSLSALEIELRYDLDNYGFFDDPEARAAIEKVADYISALVTDELGSIDPADFPPSPGEPPTYWQPTYLEPLAGGGEFAIPNTANLVVPENTLIIYVGSRPLTSTAQGGPGGISAISAEYAPFEWSNQLFNRSEPGALERLPNNTFSTPTDFAPWGGTIFFSSNITNWNFSEAGSESVEDFNFIPVAMHEFFHVLGIGNIGSFSSSWLPLIQTGAFDGELAKRSNGNSVVYLGDSGVHWWSGTAASNSVGLFSQEHGTPQQALMEGSSITTGYQFFVPTDLDLAALADIGWELDPNRGCEFEPNLNITGAQASLFIPTSSGNNYIINRSNNLSGFSPSGEIITGNGSVRAWSDPNIGANSAFYTIETIPNHTAGGVKSVAPTKSSQIKSIDGIHTPPTLPPAQEPHDHDHAHPHSHPHPHSH
ncbi:MAG: hypothetical protein AAGC74_08380 [Verrucomicrobiota bacterium]